MRAWSTKPNTGQSCNRAVYDVDAIFVIGQTLILRRVCGKFIMPSMRITYTTIIYSNANVGPFLAFVIAFPALV